MRRFSNVIQRYRYAVVGLWLVVLVVGASTLGLTVERLGGESSFPGRPAYEANVAIEQRYDNGGEANPMVVVATLPEATTGDAPATSAAVRDASAALDARGLRVVSYAQTGDRAFLPGDGRTVLGVVNKPFVPLSNPRAAQRQIDLAGVVTTAFEQALPAGTRVDVTGLDQLAASEEDEEGGSAVAVGETVTGMIAALVILGIAFGSLLAAVPVLIAVVSIVAGFLTILGLTYVTDIADLVQYVLAFVGLGVAVDYALLIVTRWREEYARSGDDIEALHRTMETAGSAVVVSGATVAVGLVVLVFLPSPSLRSMALGGVLVPLFSVLVTLTLLPALLRIAGPRLDWPGRRAGQTPPRLWNRWAELVVRHRWASFAVAMCILLPLSAMAFMLRLGDPPSSALDNGGQFSPALHTMRDHGVPTGMLTPIDILVPAAVDPAAVAARAARVDGVHTAVAPDSPAWRDDKTALATVFPVAETMTPEGVATVAAVRDAMAASFPTVQVGGAGAQLIDEIDAQYSQFPLYLTVINLIAFIMLARAFRSLLLAARAVLQNLLSIGAAYGVLVLVWQYGVGPELIWGVRPIGAISTFVPLLTFSFLFGLSMDYEVFLMARMREQYDATGSAHAAITEGLGHVGRLVTYAALIMFASFVSLSMLPEVHAKVMATGLGAGILVDATVLRMLLLPSLTAIGGRWTWWLPAGAARLLRVAPSPLAPPPRTSRRDTRAGRPHGVR